jgi:diaminohydroxyphosphoribosylaminopyrimidine deaminase/5-amino-6-(5-phosphoribosylamino)uracil reductase
MALAAAGARTKGATAYITLEPCAHHGETPPCADAVIAAGVARVVVAIADPNPRTAGKGIAKLEAAGIAVTRNVLKDRAAFVAEGFFKRVTLGRPMVALKSAESTDGFVGRPGSRISITGEAARKHGHLLRAMHDAIMVGIGTVVADEPLLTCRLPGMEDRTPLRIVIDTHLRLPVSSRLAQTARTHPVLVFTAAKSEGNLEKLGIDVVRVGAANARIDLARVMSALAKRGLTRVLVEGGPTLQHALLDIGLADRAHLYRAHHRLDAGIAGVGARVTANTRLQPFERRPLGADILESYALKP